jgi:hypothetical protein
MNVIAALTIALLAPVFVWAWRQAPGEQAKQQFLDVWRTKPWGTQIVVDFFFLEAMLALWMASDAAIRASWIAWVACIICIVAMPVFGAIPAAIYWLLRALF